MPSCRPPQKRPPLRPRATMTAAGKTYHLLMGDAHRHTDIRGHSGVDGSVLDTYRYAMDAAQLDWLGTSDHNEVATNWPDGLRDYQWWYVQKTVDLMSHPPVFIGVYSYEHSLNRPSGHRNILFLKRGGPLRVVDRDEGGRQPAAEPVEVDDRARADAAGPEAGHRAAHVRRDAPADGRFQLAERALRLPAGDLPGRALELRSVAGCRPARSAAIRR